MARHCRRIGRAVALFSGDPGSKRQCSAHALGRSRPGRHLDECHADALFSGRPSSGRKNSSRPTKRPHSRSSAIQQTNADRPLRPGEVGAYNDAFFERGKQGVKSRRTSLIIDPPDGRIPPFTPEAQKRFDARQAEEALRPADGPEDRWLTERCVLFGATVPMLPEPYNNNYLIVQIAWICDHPR